MDKRDWCILICTEARLKNGINEVRKKIFVVCLDDVYKSYNMSWI